MPDSPLIPLENADPTQSPTIASPPTNVEAAALPDDDADLEQQTIEVAHDALPQKKEAVIPAGVVRSERAARRQAEKQAKDTAQQLDTLKQQFGQVAPLLQALQSRPDIVQALQSGRPVQQAEPKPEDDPDLIAYAEAHGLYNAQGQPDASRAQKALAIEEKRFRAAVQQEVQPLRQTTAQTQAQAIRQQMFAQKDDKGKPYADPKMIEQLTANLPPEVLTQPGVAQWVLITARGMNPGYSQAQPEPAEPLFTEAPGGRRIGGPRVLSAVEKYAAQSIGVDEKTWSKLVDQAATAQGRGTIPLE